MGSEANNANLFDEWNGFGFRFVKKSDYPKVFPNLHRTFYVDEPINQILGLSPERIADMDQLYTNVLDLNHGNFYAYPLDQSDKVASVMINYIHEKDKKLPAFKPRQPSPFQSILSVLRGRYNVHQERGVDSYPELYIISTDHEFRGKGLATEMYRRAIKYMKNLGHSFVISEFTNPASRKIGEKLGFKPVARIDLGECKKDDGTLLFGEAEREHCVVMTILEL